MRLALFTPVFITLAGCCSIRAPKPSPLLTPAEVVTIQLEALQNVNQPVPNAGVWIVYQFASPGNRQVTGPYGRFLQMIKSPANRALLKAHSLKIGRVHQEGSQAEVTATVSDGTGTVSEWSFSLSKQSSQSCADCWMTDGVSQLR